MGREASLMKSLIEQADGEVTLLTRLGEKGSLRNFTGAGVRRGNRQLAG